MNGMPDGAGAGNNDDYLTSKRQAWFAFAMTFATNRNGGNQGFLRKAV
ncbi:hypothetical protein PQQ87_19255 [Paraburkholderia nemoris]